MTEQKKSVPFFEQLVSMQANFWFANLMEAGERLAFFGVRAVLPLYLFGANSILHLSMTEKGIIYGVWALLQTLIPMTSGGYTDAYGYKKSLYVAFGINIAGYSLMANATGFWSMLAAGVLVGTGTAIFKPPVQGVIAKSVDEETSGLGFGIFYWVVNVGGFLAPMAAALARGTEENPTWPYVFYGAAMVTALNYLPAIFLFREPPVEPDAELTKKSPLQVFRDTITVLWRDRRMLRFLLVISGFWFMFMQLWDLLPNFIDEWIDTRDVGSVLTGVLGQGASGFLTADGGAKPEILINIDSFTIILLVLPLSWFFARFRMVTALLTGMIIGLLGFVGAGLTQIGIATSILIFVFAIGEIVCSPKFSEYIGMTAPKDKKALYMGYSNIPFAIGWFAGNIVSGPLYDSLSSRTVFARDYLVSELGMTRAAASAIEPSHLLDTIAAKMGAGATAYDATQALWDTYHPWVIWVVLGAVGLLSVVSMTWSYLKADAADQAPG